MNTLQKLHSALLLAGLFGSLSFLNACGYSSSKSSCLLGVCSSTNNSTLPGTVVNPAIPAVPTIPSIPNLAATATPPASAMLYTVIGNSKYLAGNGTAAVLNAPTGLVKDSVGNIYFADTQNYVIRKMDRSGNITLFAGTPGTSGSTDSAPGVAALFDGPGFIAIDVNDNVYVADQYNYTVRKISPTGVVVTFAGTAGTYGTTDGPSNTTGLLGVVSGITVDTSGTVYVSDGNAIRKISILGEITTIAGSASNGYADGQGAAAIFNQPRGLAVDATGNVYVADVNNEAIRKVLPDGTVTTFAGIPGNSTETDGPLVSAVFSTPVDVAFDSSGNLYVTDLLGETIRQITKAGMVSTLAGGFQVIGTTDGNGPNASFNYPYGITVDQDGNLIVSDQLSNILRKVTLAGDVTTIAGTPPVQGNQNTTKFGGQQYTAGIAVDSAGNMFTSVYNLIQKTTPQGVTTIFAGDYVAGHADGVGTAASFYNPSGIVIDGNDYLYVADASNGMIRKISPAGVVTTLAGSYRNTNGGGKFFGDTITPTSENDGTGSAATFYYPSYLAIDSNNNLYASSTRAGTIRKITQLGVVTTLAGTYNVEGYVDDTGPAAQFERPQGIAADSAGNIYVADTGNCVIRQITPAGVTTTFAGDGNCAVTDGVGTAASFNLVQGITIDNTGNLYVTEQEGVIRKITTPGAVVTTIGGKVEVEYGTADGNDSVGLFGEPDSITIDANGNLLIADELAESVRGFTSLLSPPAVGSRVVPASFPVVTPPVIIPVSNGSLLTTLVGPADYLDGPGTTARMNLPSSVAVKANGVIFFADTANHVIRKIAKDGTVSLYAGIPGVAGNTDGTGEVAQFHSPNGLAFDANNNLYVADTGNALIRMIAPQGIVTTLAGTNGEFEAPYGIAIDSKGFIFVSDQVQNTISNVNPTNGTVNLSYGTADVANSTDGQFSNALFNGPTGIAFDSSNDLWIADTLNGTIRMADPYGNVTTVDGMVGQLATIDGDPTTAQFTSPIGLAIDSNDDVYISDQVDNVIRLIDPSTFVVTTVAGSLKWMKSNKNTTTFNGPEGLAFTSKNVLIIADTQNGMIRQMTEKNETVTDVAGAGGATTAGDNANPVLGMVIDSQGNTFYTQGNKIKKLDVNGNSTVFAGGSKGNADGNGAVATFSAPSGIGIDSNDYLYVADTGNNLIRQISPSADVITYAGNLKKAKRDIDANGVLASFLSPVGITVDAGGTVYVSESLGFTIRAIDTSGNVTTLAGSNNNDGWVDGKGNKAEFETPGAMVADSSGNIFVVDAANDVIRKVNPSGKVTTFAGAGLTPGTVDGIGTSAMFEGLSGITIDGLDNLYVTQTTGAIRKITPARVVTTLMVDSQQLSASSIDGDADVGRLGTPTAITVDYNGNLIFADANLTSIREYTSLASLVSPHLGGTPVISVPIPSPAPSSAVPINYGSIKTLGGFTGYVDGAAADARFNQPTGVAYDSLGNLFIVDSGNQVIRKMDTSGNVTLFAGSPGNPGYADGQGSAAQFTGPYAIAFNSAGNMFVTDTGNDLIRMITPGGLVSTYAGDGAETSTDGNGINAEFDDPRGITIDGNDNIYVSDEGSNLIRLINTNGDVSTLAGNGTGSSDGQGVNASFSQPMGIFSIASSLLVADLTNNELRYIDSNANVTTFVDPNSYLDNPIAVTADQNGNTFVLNQEGSTIEMIDSNGNSSILAGISRTFGSTDGNASTALFFGSMGITTDPSGNVIVADTDNNTIRKITPAGMTTTIAGRAPATYPTPAPLIPGAKKETQVRVTADVNGTGDRAILGQVMGMATDSNGNIFMTTSFDTIRKITPSGVVTTFAGSGLDGDTDGTGTAAAFSDPIGIAIDSANNLYVADSGNSAIRKITPSGVVTTLGAGLNARIKATPNQNGPVQTYDFSNPTGIAVTSSGVIYVSDNGTNTVDFIATDGTETVFAGDGTSNFADGNGVSAEFNNPYSIIFDGSGNLIVVDAGNNAIRQINSNGEVTTIAGKNSPWDGADGYDYTTFTPIGITMDAHGDFEIATIGNGGPTYLVQTYVDNDRFTSGSLGGIQKIDPSGVLTPVAGVPVAQLNAPLPPNLISKVLDNNGLYTGQSSTDGDLPLAQSIPTSIATDRAGNVIMGSAITGFENFYVLRNAKYLDSGLLDTRSPVLTDLTDAVRTPVLTAEDTDLPLYNELGIGELGSIRVLLRAP